MKRLQLFGNPKVQIWMQGPMDWYEAVGVELAVTWGNIPQWVWEVRNMRYIRAQTCWLEGTHDDLRDRRSAVLGIARGMISSKDARDMEIDNLYPLIPVDTVSPRLANVICVAYDDAPDRTFCDPESEDATAINSGFEDLYEELDINEVMDRAYRAALFTNTVLILWSDEEQQFLVLTPEYFRIEENGIWVARRVGIPGANSIMSPGEIVYDVWRNDVHEVRNAGGKLMTSQCEENPWGMLPGVLMKLVPSNDLYGAGIVEAAEVNAASNLVELFAMRVAHAQGFSVGVLKNFVDNSGGTAAKNSIRVSPGTFLNMRSPDVGMEPDFKYVSPDPKFIELQEFKNKKIAAFERQQDLPGFLIDDSVTPPSGVALQVLERQLTRKRKKHLSALRRTERDLLKFVQKLAKKRGRNLVSDTFEIKYANPQLFTDPTEDLEFDMNKAASGLVTPSGLVTKYLGVQKGMTDQEAVEMMQKNKQMFAFLTLPETKVNVSD